MHDAGGNLTQLPQPGAEGTRLHATYDAWNRLTKVQADDAGAPGATIAEYQYDAGHKRTVKLKPNGGNWDRRDYYYSCEWQVVEERELLNTAAKTTLATVPKFQWVWDLRYQDAPVLRDENKDGDGDCIDGTDQRLYYTQDANFNTTALITTGGTVVERYVYTGLYGKVSVLSASWATQASTLYSDEVLFGGYRLDPETGLYLVRRRHYHATLGRWVQRDPAGYHDGPNLYEYVGGNPAIRRDPSGMTWSPLPEGYPVALLEQSGYEIRPTGFNGRSTTWEVNLPGSASISLQAAYSVGWHGALPIQDPLMVPLDESGGDCCGADVTDALIAHFNDWQQHELGWTSPWTWEDPARANAGSFDTAIRNTNRVSGCGTGRCEGTATVCGWCISRHHVDHILVMTYLTRGQGPEWARVIGLAQEWRGDNPPEESAADLVMNDVAIEAFGNQLRNEDGGPRPTLTRYSVCAMMTNLGIGGGIQRKVARKPSAATPPKYDYYDCPPCKTRVPKPDGLILPAISPQGN